LGYVREAIEAQPDCLQAYRLIDRRTVLELAAEAGQVEMCKLLLISGEGANDKVHPRAGEYLKLSKVPLFQAAGSGDVATIKLLIEWGALVDGSVDTDAPPLMAAAAMGHLAATRTLLEAGADVNRENYQSWTPLDMALSREYTEVAALLRSRGGIALVSDNVDWSEEPDGPYVEHIQSVSGPVLPISIGHIVSTRPAADICLRIARMAPKTPQKLVFTSGVGYIAGTEFALCLSADWPINSSSAKVPEYDWPVALLFALASELASGLRVKHGTVVTADMPALAQCALPLGMEFLATLHAGVEAKRNGNAELPQLLLLAPCKVSKTKRTAEWYISAADKLASKKWAALAFDFKSVVLSVSSHEGS
jgi:ankyrin repeat protein